MHARTHTHTPYSHAIRPWIHSSSACIELNMLSIDCPVSREQTRGHVKVSVCKVCVSGREREVWLDEEGQSELVKQKSEGDREGEGNRSREDVMEGDRKTEIESIICDLDRWISEWHCCSVTDSLSPNQFPVCPSGVFLSASVFTFVFLSVSASQPLSKLYSVVWCYLDVTLLLYLWAVSADWKMRIGNIDAWTSVHKVSVCSAKW